MHIDDRCAKIQIEMVASIDYLDHKVSFRCV
jgi:hypothetical protein